MKQIWYVNMFGLGCVEYSMTMRYSRREALWTFGTIGLELLFKKKKVIFCSVVYIWQKKKYSFHIYNKML